MSLLQITFQVVLKSDTKITVKCKDTLKTQITLSLKCSTFCECHLTKEFMNAHNLHVGYLTNDIHDLV